jgi:alpha-glucosidase
MPDEHHAMAIEAQAADPRSVLARCRQLLRFRRAHPALRTGSLALREAPAPLWAFERHDDAERLLCVINLSNQPATWPIEDGWAPLDGHGFDARIDGGSLQLPAFGVFFGTRAPA